VTLAQGSVVSSYSAPDSDASSSEYIASIQVLQNVFTIANIKVRAHLAACHFINADANLSSRYLRVHSPMYRGYFHQLRDLLNDEYNYIRQHIRIFQRRKLRRMRKIRTTPRKLSAYIEFCRGLRAKYTHEQLQGSVQRRWIEHKDSLLQHKMRCAKAPKQQSHEEWLAEQQEQEQEEEEEEDNNSENADTEVETLYSEDEEDNDDDDETVATNATTVVIEQ
jgi:hypothetical protein